jgi:hypothetical protein
VLKSFLLLAGLAVISVADHSPALAANHSALDITGDWRLDIEQKRRCRWQGRVRLDQNGVQLTGGGEAVATKSQRFCPNLKGEVEGSVNGAQVNFGFATGRLGTGEFEGTLGPGGRILSGTWSAGRAVGTWRAERVN